MSDKPYTNEELAALTARSTIDAHLKLTDPRGLYNRKPGGVAHSKVNPKTDRSTAHRN